MTKRRHSGFFNLPYEMRESSSICLHKSPHLSQELGKPLFYSSRFNLSLCCFEIKHVRRVHFISFTDTKTEFNFLSIILVYKNNQGLNEGGPDSRDGIHTMTQKLSHLAEESHESSRKHQADLTTKGNSLQEKSISCQITQFRSML